MEPIELNRSFLCTELIELVLWEKSLVQKQLDWQQRVKPIAALRFGLTERLSVKATVAGLRPMGMA